MSSSCLICLEEECAETLQPCGHVCHMNCIEQYAFCQGILPCCPACRGAVSNLKHIPSPSTRQRKSEERSMFNATQSGLDLYTEEVQEIQLLESCGQLKKANLLKLKLQVRLQGKYHLLELLEEAEMHLQIGQNQMMFRLLQIVWMDYGLDMPLIRDILMQISSLYQQNHITEALALHKHVDELLRVAGVRLYSFWYQSFDSDFEALIQPQQQECNGVRLLNHTIRSRLNPAARPFVPSGQMLAHHTSLR
jgi:hypothetical protein